MSAKIEFIENENQNEVLIALEDIRHWISKQAHLNSRQDDDFLLAFLRHSKLRVEMVKDKLECYLSFKTLCPEYYVVRLSIDGKIRSMVESNCFVVLPDNNPSDQTKVIYANLEKFIKNDFGPNELMCFGLMIYDRLTLYDVSVMQKGFHVIMDVKGGSLEFGSQFIPHLKRIVYIIQHAYPIRVSGIHFSNLSQAPAVYSVIIKLLKKFLKPKLANRLYAHKNNLELQEKISKKILPTEADGSAGSLQSLMDKCNWQQKFLSEEAREWFKKDMEFKSDESKRIGKFKGNELFGVDGTFKKLDID